MAGDWLADGRQAKRDKANIEHEKDLAYKGQLREHLEAINGKDDGGHYSPLAYVVAFIVLCFGVTYCTATLTCFFDSPAEIIYTKDPTEDTRSISIFFGAFKWDLANNRILAMSKAGLGFLLLYPVIFILSMVTTGDRPKGRK